MKEIAVNKNKDLKGKENFINNIENEVNSEIKSTVSS